ncbi:DUF3883 domain-containing protein [Pigmentiphaga litoralis]|uniref:DUF3883 domain-containing protein n=1 Tax=Pigmentiphaga litoralis TaxID=516702 RepID=UPI001676E9D3|nr:DUF3883 domain-containing protein [Pigmentiphaga litoralis]
MASNFAGLSSPAAVQAALDQYEFLGRTAFLERHGFGKSRDFLVRNPRNGELADSKAIVGAAFSFEYPDAEPLRAADFSGGVATVVAKLRSLGFDVVKIGEDWSADEVRATVAAYFDMLLLEANRQPFNKSDRNAQLRQTLTNRSKGSVEMKHQNVSAVLSALGLPFISGYKPRVNAQLLLRKIVQEFVRANTGIVQRIVDSMEDFEAPSARMFTAVLVDAPALEEVANVEAMDGRLRLPRKVNYAARDENNRRLGRAGEEWVLGYEQHRLQAEGLADLYGRVDWVADSIGDGLGYDILSFDSSEKKRYIEVKTTNGSYSSSFIVSRNELDFAKEVGPAFYLYRVFQFREQPKLYMLQGDLSDKLHLEPMDYRASFRRLSL